MDEGERPEQGSATGLVPGFVAERLFRARTVVISGEINQKVAANVISQLLALAADSNDDITCYINSQGGKRGGWRHDSRHGAVSSPRACGWWAPAGWRASPR